ncbi:kinase-like domain-containing protein [Mycena pura]|uniref:Kinase-like domain-containing protein n=1 Tax=Mycena pura TaxID=153505 RepID=A0AAD6VJC1_9AGAR|nr:kinase-like domain-containing protein [Mycena pura]
MSYARLNNATRAEIDQSQVFATGAFKIVWKGVYTVGARRGERCVAKEFKTGSVYEKRYFEEEMNVIRLTQGVIDAWHAEQIITRDIRLNTPQIWEMIATGAKVLVEPMIENFEKFNSNTGWASNTGGAWSDAMQALSHFSFHNSNGEFLLCDLQGGVYSDGYVLSDPVIMSRGQNCGPTDLGLDGIRSFFQRHRCGSFCKSGWMKPRVIGRAVHPMRMGTTMINPAHLPTRANRTPLTRVQEGY